MGQQDLAHVAVTITQIIKTNSNLDPQEIIQQILSDLPELTTNEVIQYFVNVAQEMGIEYKDVEDIILYMQSIYVHIKTDASWNTWSQNLAQVGLLVLYVGKGFLPPKWRLIVESVLDAYDKMKGTV